MEDSNLLTPEHFGGSLDQKKWFAEFAMRNGVRVDGLQSVLSAKEIQKLETQIRQAEFARTSEQEIAYLHSCLCMVGFPRKRVEGDIFQRRWGSSHLMVRGGYLNKSGEMVKQEVPYGPLPRLITAYMNRIIKQTKARNIPLFFTMRRFMSELGIEDAQQTGGKHGRIGYFMRALEATIACELILGWDDETSKDNTAWIRTSDVYRPWYTTSEDQGALFQGEIIVSEPYYQMVTNHSVPMNFTAMKHLKGSSLALDIYVWLAYRMNSLTGKGMILSWENLHGQFGQEYTGSNKLKKFRTKFLQALRLVEEVYPGLEYKILRGRLQVLPSPTPIAKRLDI